MDFFKFFKFFIVLNLTYFTTSLAQSTIVTKQRAEMLQDIKANKIPLIQITKISYESLVMYKLVMIYNDNLIEKDSDWYDSLERALVAASKLASRRTWGIRLPNTEDFIHPIELGKSPENRILELSKQSLNPEPTDNQFLDRKVISIEFNPDNSCFQIKINVLPTDTKENFGRCFLSAAQAILLAINHAYTESHFLELKTTSIQKIFAPWEIANYNKINASIIFKASRDFYQKKSGFDFDRIFFKCSFQLEEDYPEDTFIHTKDYYNNHYDQYPTKNKIFIVDNEGDYFGIAAYDEHDQLQLKDWYFSSKKGDFIIDLIRILPAFNFKSSNFHSTHTINDVSFYREKAFVKRGNVADIFSFEFSDGTKPEVKEDMESIPDSKFKELVSYITLKGGDSNENSILIDVIRIPTKSIFMLRFNFRLQSPHHKTEIPIFVTAEEYDSQNQRISKQHVKTIFVSDDNSWNTFVHQFEYAKKLSHSILRVKISVLHDEAIFQISEPQLIVDY